MFRRITRALSSFIQTLEPRQLFSAITPANIIIAAGDLNGDGLADKAIIHRDLATRNILLTTYTTSRKEPPARRDSVDLTADEFDALTIGDVNGDGAPDIIVASHTRHAHETIQIFLGDGKGGLARAADGSVKPASIDLPAGLDVSSIVAADFNGDHKAEIAVLADQDDSALIGLLTPQQKTEFAILRQRLDLNADTLFAGDLDHDGLPDLVAVASSNKPKGINSPNLFTITSVGKGNLSSAQSNPLYHDKGLEGQNPLYEGARTIGLGDLDGDGVPELIGLLRTRAGHRIIFEDSKLDAKTIQFTDPDPIPTTGYLPAVQDQFVVADFDGDGRADLQAISPIEQSQSTTQQVTSPDGTSKLIWSPRSNIDLYGATSGR